MIAPSPYAMVIEDDPDFGALLRLHLETLGFHVLHTQTAEAALDHLIESRPPDVVLVDIMLPGVDGRHVIRRLQASPRFAESRIVVATVVPPDELGVKVHAVLPKPFSRGDLVRALEEAGQPLPRAE